MRTPTLLPPVVDEEEESRRLSACGAYTTERLDEVQGIWFLHLVTYFGGAPYEYLVEAGRDVTLDEAEYRLGAFGIRERLRERFLREVQLEIMQ